MRRTAPEDTGGPVPTGGSCSRAGPVTRASIPSAPEPPEPPGRSRLLGSPPSGPEDARGPLRGVDVEPDEPGADASTPGYFGTRLAHDPNRAKVWQHLTAYLSRWIAPDARVLELGAGWCDFANHVAAAEVVALDADATVRARRVRVSPRWSATAPTCRSSRTAGS